MTTNPDPVWWPHTGPFVGGPWWVEPQGCSLPRTCNLSPSLGGPQFSRAGEYSCQSEQCKLWRDVKIYKKYLTFFILRYLMTKIKFRSYKCMTPKGQFLSNLCRNNLHLISNTSKQKKKLSDKRIFFGSMVCTS